MPESGSSLPRVLSPLWVISLFLGMSEIAVTIAITQAHGWIQALLAIFAVAFPTLVAGVFFYILWYDNKVLYAPRDFAEGTTVTEYAEAMSRSARRGVQVVETALLDRLAEELAALGTSEARRKEILAAVGDAARQTVVTIDISAFGEPGDVIDIPVDADTGVDELLDEVYFAISHEVDAFTYGTAWLLRDDATGRVYERIGTQYARRSLHTGRDARPLDEVGIKPGASLTAIRPRVRVPPRRSPASWHRDA